jgi:hypothetical protein
VCIYNHDEEIAAAGGVAPAPAQTGFTPPPMPGKGKGKGKGKGGGFPPQPVAPQAFQQWGGKPLHVNDLPPTAQPVTLFGESGYFIPSSAIAGLDGPPMAALPAPGPQIGQKRPMPSVPQRPPSERLHPNQVPCKRGAECRLFQQGVCIYNHEAEGAPPPQ